MVRASKRKKRGKGLSNEKGGGGSWLFKKKLPGEKSMATGTPLITRRKIR